MYIPWAFLFPTPPPFPNHLAVRQKHVPHPGEWAQSVCFMYLFSFAVWALNPGLLDARTFTVDLGPWVLWGAEPLQTLVWVRPVRGVRTQVLMHWAITLGFYFWLPHHNLTNYAYGRIHNLIWALPFDVVGPHLLICKVRIITPTAESVWHFCLPCIHSFLQFSFSPNSRRFLWYCQWRDSPSPATGHPIRGPHPRRHTDWAKRRPESPKWLIRVSSLNWRWWLCKRNLVLWDAVFPLRKESIPCGCW